MDITSLDEQTSISQQITPEDIDTLSQQGIEIIICNRPDNESADQTPFDRIKAAANNKGIEAIHIPFVGSKMQDQDVINFVALLGQNKKIHAYCRTGNRSKTIWSSATKKVASDNNKTRSTLQNKSRFDIIIIGAGSGGIAVASSIAKRKKQLRIALVDPAGEHFYQPGWTMVGGGVFDAPSTCRNMQALIPNGVEWVQEEVVQFFPDENSIRLANDNTLHYDQLIVAPGLTLNWSAIEGLEETLGKNGVTSNYRYDLAPYTWELVQELKKGRALFTQPPMPIKCAGAPQKALYLSADYWFKNTCLHNIDVDFYNAGPVLFGVSDYVPALMQYMEKYQTNLKFSHNLIKVDGNAKKAWFASKDEKGDDIVVETTFDMLHVCPPQSAPQFIQDSALSDAAGWLDVHPETLQHKHYSNIWGIGDVLNTPNAKTMAAARKQAPVVAENICRTLDKKKLTAAYDGYGSCPLTVERGKIVLAEFIYGGKLDPSFPQWLNDGTQATKLAWHLKENILPAFYWRGMLKGNELLATPKELATAD